MFSPMGASPTDAELSATEFSPRYEPFDRVVRRRRSIRRFSKRPVAAEDVNDVIDAALLAPNSSNLQPFEFVWVRSADKKKALVEACLSQSAARTAQELVVAVARWDRWDETRREYLTWLEQQNGIPKPVMLYYRGLANTLYSQGPFSVAGTARKVVTTVSGLFRAVPRGPVSNEDMRVWAVKTTALACENLMLAAVAKGLDSCPMEGMDSVRVGRIIGATGSKWDIPMVIGLGYRAETAIWATQWRRDRDKLVREI